MKGRLLLIGAAFGLLAIALILVPPTEERLPPLTMYSAAPSGGKGLRLWLEELGYTVSTLESVPYRVPREARTLLILAPIRFVAPSEAGEVERWVRAGGTLVVATDGLPAETLLQQFDVRLAALPEARPLAAPLGDAILDPAIEEVRVEATDSLLLPADAVPLLGDGPHIFAARKPHGSGLLVVLSAPAALNNRSLRQTDNARFALSLVGPPSRGAVVFDELHHGYGASEPRNLLTLLLERAWGHAALYAAALAFLYVVLRGRRFGRAVPIVISRGRSLAEYVTSLAALYRAGRKRQFVAEHFRRRLRRQLVHDLALPADASSEQIAARAALLSRDPGPALRALERLGRADGLGEAELVSVVGAAEQAIASGRRRAVRGVDA